MYAHSLECMLSFGCISTRGDTEVTQINLWELSDGVNRGWVSANVCRMFLFQCSDDRIPFPAVLILTQCLLLGPIFHVVVFLWGKEDIVGFHLSPWCRGQCIRWLTTRFCVQTVSIHLPAAGGVEWCWPRNFDLTWHSLFTASYCDSVFICGDLDYNAP